MLNTKKATKKEPVAEIHTTTVGEIAQNYGLTVDITVKELKKIGIKKKLSSDFVEDKFLEQALEHFDKAAKEIPSKSAKTTKEVKAKAILTDVAKVATAPLLSATTSTPEDKEISLKTPITVKMIADAVGKKPSEIIMNLMQMNILASINQTIDPKVAKTVFDKYGLSLVIGKTDKEEAKIEHVLKAESALNIEKSLDKPEDLTERPPVVTFMGHVDHGKTSIQDAIRKTNVVKGEAGGITQHTGASVIVHKDKTIVFIDTPGHEAFTAMRARGANVTDIVVLVVAADDGFMPQTVEALSHAKAAKVPIIVAMNKIDLHSADPDKVLLHMQQNSLTSEEWGGDVGVIKVSALTGKGLPELLDRILLEAEILELKANRNRPAEGIVLEAELEQGHGPVANVIVRNGSLNIGDVVLCEQHYGKIKALIDGNGARVKSVGPSLPAKIVGLSGVPNAGAIFSVVKNEKIASDLASTKADDVRSKGLTKTNTATLEDLFSDIKNNQRNDLNLIIKTDVQGTAEAIKDSLQKLPSEKIKVNIVHSAVGGISDSDIMLASASNAIVVGFHVKVNTGVNDLAKRQKVEIRLYSIIYELIEDIKDALEGRLAPDQREVNLGKAQILKIFDVSKGPKVCGCLVEEGYIKVGGKARIYRNKELIFAGIVQSLRRFQNDVKEVKAGQECGIRLNNFLDFQENDLISIYDIEFNKASL
ncbi:MAG: translation initiation factor IF-2 [Lentisphaerota bacterium]